MNSIRVAKYLSAGQLVDNAFKRSIWRQDGKKERRFALLQLILRLQAPFRVPIYAKIVGRGALPPLFFM